MRILDERHCTVKMIYGAMGMGMGSCPPPPAPTEPHLIGTSPGIAGSLWISGALLRFRSDDGNEYGETGTSQPTPSPAALVRALRFEDSGENLDYMDDSGVHRRVSKTSLGTKPSGAITRSLRYDTSGSPSHSRARVQWTGVSNYYKWHNGF